MCTALMAKRPVKMCWLELEQQYVQVMQMQPWCGNLKSILGLERKR